MSGITTPDPALDVIFTEVSDLLSALGSVNVVNVTEEGLLLALTVVVEVTMGDVNPRSNIEITIDDGTLRTFPLYTADPANGSWGLAGLRHFKTSLSDLGDAAGDNLVMPVGARYARSLLVSHNVSAIAVSGTIRIGVLRGVAL